MLQEKKLSKEAYVKELTGESMPKPNAIVRALGLGKKEEVKEEIKGKKKLCIIGTANSRHKAPWDDPDAEFWGVAHCLLLSDILKLDKVFEIHKPYIYNKEVSPFSQKPILYHVNKETNKFQIKNNGKDITAILPVDDKNINSYEIFQREYLKDKYRDLIPESDVFYATNSIAWMIVMALDKIIEEEAYDELHLYGIHLETDTEWQYERPCNEWWLGVICGYLLAKGKRGVIHMPEESDVLRGYHEYGFADIEVRRKKLVAKIQHFDGTVRDMVNNRTLLSNEMNKLRNEISIPSEKKIESLNTQIGMMKKEVDKYGEVGKEAYDKELMEAINKRLSVLNNDIITLDARINAFNGAKEQVQYFLKELNA